jgi:hypothetical protein
VNLRILVPWLGAVAVSCALLQPRFETITPEFGYVDGCTDVILGGAYIGTDATVTIGGEALLAIEPAAYDTAFPEYAQDVGFEYAGRTPPSPGREPGWADVVMTIPPEKEGGKEFVRRLPDGFYYMACPGSVHVDTLGLPTADETGDTAGPVAQPVPAGETVPLIGCGLDATKVEVALRNGDGSIAFTLPLVQDCSTAIAHIDIPDVANGAYYLTIEHEDGTTLGYDCSDDTDADTASETDLSACALTIPVDVVGGAP